jgi:GLPGLI family protein
MAAVAVFCLRAMMPSAQVVIDIVNPDDAIRRETIDTVLFTAQYEMSSVADTAHRKRMEQEMMMLKVGGKSSVFYSYAKYLADSVVQAETAAGTSVSAIVQRLREYHSSITYKIYKNYPAGKVTTLEQFTINRYRCEEKNDVPPWQVLSDTATVLSYPCRKAVCRFRGRDYEAWFTLDIPRNEGPWKLHGLPGLILRAQDAKREYIFECVALVQGKAGETIAYGASGYEPVSRKDLNRQYERYAADPIEYVKSSSPNVRVEIHDETVGAVHPRNMPYNPIELGK